MEEVGLPQVGRRLLLEVGSPDPRAVEDQCDHLGADCDTCAFLLGLFTYFSSHHQFHVRRTVTKKQ